MKVQRCPSCGRGYSVERLEPGATFECRRCQATVEVAATGRRDGSVSVGLLVAGLLALVAIVLYANPRYGVVRSWPWELFQQADSLAVRVNLAIWVLLGLWAVVTALVPAFERRSLATLAVGLVALILASSPEGQGLELDLPRTLPWMAGVIAVGAGFALVLHDRFGLATRLLLLAGGLALAWLFVGRFDVEVDTSRIVLLVREVRGLLAGTLEAESASAYSIWGTLAPQLGTLLVAALAFLIGLGARWRPFAWIGGICLVAVMLLPGAARLGSGLEGQAFDIALLGAALLGGVAYALIGCGVALWLLLWLAIADLVRTAEVPS